MSFFRPTPKEKGIKGAQGAESEMIIAAELVRAGYTVLTPNGYMHRYDLVIEDADGRFWKLQCKTAWLVERESGTRALNFMGCSISQKGQKGRRETTRKGYRTEVDYFAVYSPDLHRVYMLPSADVVDTDNHLNLEQTKNGQKKGIKYAADYEL